MLIGSGLMARGFAPIEAEMENACIYAAGVSNSGCKDMHEYAREETRLREALGDNQDTSVFVYFGTCSVLDPEARNTPYVQHKLVMEELVACSHPRSLILRLPQVAGRTPNPHTLLNYLYARISRSEAFAVWSKARRNIIDVDDIVLVARQLIKDPEQRNTVQNIANPAGYSMPDIVRAMEQVVGKPAVFDVVERTSAYDIDLGGIKHVMDSIPIDFGDGYLDRILRKYYEPFIPVWSGESLSGVRHPSREGLLALDSETC